LGVRVHEQLVGIEAVARIGLVGPVYADAVDGAGADTLEVAVPDLVGVFRQVDTGDLRLAAPIEEADFDLGRGGGEDGEVRAAVVGDRAELQGAALAHGDVSEVHGDPAGVNAGLIAG